MLKLNNKAIINTQRFCHLNFFCHNSLFCSSHSLSLPLKKLFVVSLIALTNLAQPYTDSVVAIRNIESFTLTEK